MCSETSLVTASFSRPGVLPVPCGYQFNVNALTLRLWSLFMMARHVRSASRKYFPIKPANNVVDGEESRSEPEGGRCQSRGSVVTGMDRSARPYVIA